MTPVPPTSGNGFGYSGCWRLRLLLRLDAPAADGSCDCSSCKRRQLLLPRLAAASNLSPADPASSGDLCDCGYCSGWRKHSGSYCWQQMRLRLQPLRLVATAAAASPMVSSDTADTDRYPAVDGSRKRLRMPREPLF